MDRYLNPTSLLEDQGAPPGGSPHKLPTTHFRYRDWKPAQRDLGIDPIRRIYDLRHTFATFTLRAGISTFDLSRAASAPA